MIYEVIGSPGSGKTTYCLNQKSYQHIFIKNLFEKIIYSMVFVLNHPYIFFLLFYWTLKEGGKISLIIHKIFNVFFKNIASFQKAYLCKKRCIIDEGLIYYSISLAEEIKKEKFFIEYINLISNLNIKPIILKEYPYKIIENRMIERGRMPRIKFGEEYSKKITRYTFKNSKELIKIIKQNEKI